jgi:hypothetical protein
MENKRKAESRNVRMSQKNLTAEVDAAMEVA